MTAQLTIEGVTITSGQIADLGIYSELQRTVMPVVSLEDGALHCWGTAACVGASGWFVTARHVVDDFIERHGQNDDGTTGLFILWETDELTGTGPANYLGAPLPVTYAHPHGDVDLVALTVRLPPMAPEHLRVAPLALRMPEFGEPLAVVGFRSMSLTGPVSATEQSTVAYERTLAVGVGEVLEQQPERRSLLPRGFPGVVTDAPIHSGMSGGPVFDARGEIIGFASSSTCPSEPDQQWNSFVVLAAPALELGVMAREFDGDDPREVTLAELVAAGAVLCEAYDTFDVDPSTGKVRFVE